MRPVFERGMVPVQRSDVAARIDASLTALEAEAA
jgi:hypothetical protein